MPATDNDGLAIRSEAEWRRLETSEACYRAIVDAAPDALITIDEFGNILSFSQRAEILFGYAASEVVGRNVSMLMPWPDATQHDQHLARCRATGRRRVVGHRRRLLGLRKDGSTFPHEIYIGETALGHEHIFIGFLRDLTAREAADAKFKEMQSELVHISRSSAIGTMGTALAHELNQPLTAIANYVQTAAAMIEANGAAALPMISRALQEAGRETLRAGAIVDHLRQFVARGELECALANPRDLIVEACELGMVGARASGITQIISAAADLPSVLVDRIQIQQVLINLMRNAVEALAGKGMVGINADVDGKLIRISIIDDGPGLPPGGEAALLEPYVTTKHDGMGLGLTICRTIVEAHGGCLWCENRQEGGAAFHFTIPIAEADDAEETPGPHR